jgi:hypothetical protein
LTGLQKGEREEGQRSGLPRVLTITLEGSNGGKDWASSFEFTYNSTEQISVKPSGSGDPAIPQEAADLKIVHIPPFSGIGAEETRYIQPEYQDLLIGQGKPGDIIRNLLLEVFEQCDKDKNDSSWVDLCEQINGIFHYQLLTPQSKGRPFIVCEYLKGIPRKGHGKDSYASLDIATAGSGFLQVLLLLAFFYARPASVLLMDEPDAHLHVILQKQVYDRLRLIASRRKCQLIIATHSEVIIDNTGPGQILSFYREPHPLVTDTDRDEVREAIKRLTATDLLLAEASPGILYLEGNSDFSILRPWSRIRNHRTKDWFSGTDCFWHNNQGRNPREARDHFFALRAVRKNFQGVLLLDGDNRGMADRDVVSEGLTIERWHRYEIENYLFRPAILLRFIASRTEPLFVNAAKKYLEDELPRGVFNEPMKQHDAVDNQAVSKTLLPGLMSVAQIELSKSEYYLIAEQMLPEEIDNEVVEKLDAIAGAVLTHGA